MSDPRGPLQINSEVAHAARVYDYLLGGSVNFLADREAAEQQARAIGGIDKARAGVRANRDFLGRAVRYLAGAGVRQYLDIGTGIPNTDNVHAVAQQAAPESRVVYVDHDPVVLAHAHSLLDSSPEGKTAYLHGDLQEPDAILDGAAATLDFTRPVAVMLVAVLHLVADDDDPHGTVKRLVEALAPGSYLVVSHMTKDVQTAEMSRLEQAAPPTARYRFAMRSHAEVSRFFEGMDMVEPGLVTLDAWRHPDPDTAESAHYGGIGRTR